jgi:hypothetical protein
MRPFLALLTAVVVACVALPADAAIVYFKDGTVARGAIVVKDASITVKGPGTEMSFPLASVRSISFTDEPIAYEQARAEDSKYLNNDALVWTAVAANLVAIAAAAATLLRP